LGISRVKSCEKAKGTDLGRKIEKLKILIFGEKKSFLIEISYFVLRGCFKASLIFRACPALLGLLLAPRRHLGFLEVGSGADSAGAPWPGLAVGAFGVAAGRPGWVLAPSAIAPVTVVAVASFCQKYLSF